MARITFQTDLGQSRILVQVSIKKGRPTLKIEGNTDRVSLHRKTVFAGLYFRDFFVAENAKFETHENIAPRRQSATCHKRSSIQKYETLTFPFFVTLIFRAQVHSKNTKFAAKRRVDIILLQLTLLKGQLYSGDTYPDSQGVF